MPPTCCCCCHASPVMMLMLLMMMKMTARRWREVYDGVLCVVYMYIVCLWCCVQQSPVHCDSPVWWIVCCSVASQSDRCYMLHAALVCCCLMWLLLLTLSWHRHRHCHMHHTVRAAVRRQRPQLHNERPPHKLNSRWLCRVKPPKQPPAAYHNTRNNIDIIHCVKIC